MQQVLDLIDNFINRYMNMPRFGVTDAVEIIIIAFLFYSIMMWVKNTRAWMLFKGIAVLIVFIIFAAIFNLSTILWIADRTFSVGVIAMLIIFQPELRKALEQLGRKRILFNAISFEENGDSRLSDKTVGELVKATFELAKTKTGALIVIEKDVPLDEYIRTGITIDSQISSQLLINIFEHNTPLHDGAVIISRDRIVSATCYLPLSDNMELSKELGTRHRAGVGISEATDSFTIIVSEETGKVTIAEGGKLSRGIDGDTLRGKLVELQNKTTESKHFKLWKGRHKDEEAANK